MEGGMEGERWREGGGRGGREREAKGEGEMERKEGWMKTPCDDKEWMC